MGAHTSAKHPDMRKKCKSEKLKNRAIYVRRAPWDGGGGAKRRHRVTAFGLAHPGGGGSLRIWGKIPHFSPWRLKRCAHPYRFFPRTHTAFSPQSRKRTRIPTRGAQNPSRRPQTANTLCGSGVLCVGVHLILLFHSEGQNLNVFPQRQTANPNCRSHIAKSDLEGENCRPEPVPYRHICAPGRENDND